MYNLLKRPQLMVMLCSDGSGSLTRLQNIDISGPFY